MEKYTKEQLNAMDKEALVQLLYNTQQLLETLVKQNQELTETIALMNQRQFGRKSEKNLVTKDQITIFDMGVNEAEVTASGQIPMEPSMETVVVQEHKRTKKKGKREEDLSRYPVTVVRHDLDDEELREKFPEGYTALPDEVYKKLEVKPATFIVKEHHIAVYKGKNGKIVKGEHPKEMLSNSIASPSLVAFIMNAKYTNAIPLYRIAQDFEQSDMILGRATMANWVIRCSERYLSLVYDKLREHLCKQSVIQADETTCQVTKDGREGVNKSYMFVYRTSELSGEKPVILYQYGKTRSKSNIQKFLQGFSGTLVSDAFSGYKSLDKNDENIRSAFCWAHARRDYADALKALKGDAKELAGETVAHKALVQIAAIYKAEEALKNVSAEERKTRRQKEVAPLVEAYFAWVHEQDPATILSEKTKDGLKYSLNQENYLKVFLEDGEVPIDNSATERAIRPFTIGRANWHIIDTIHGAQASAVIYSLVETAKANRLKVYEYLKHLLTEIPKHMDNTSLDFLEDLLPWSKNLPEECRKKI